MHKIHFEKRSLIICGIDEPSLHDPNAIVFRPGNSTGFKDMVEMLEGSSSLDHIYIPTENIGLTYAEICSEFKEVNAGGGLVSNRRGDYLLISRNGLWDLPKGHQDHGPLLQTRRNMASEAYVVVRHAPHRPCRPHTSARGRHSQSRMGRKIQPA